MSEETPQRIGFALMPAAVAAYLARPWSCGAALSRAAEGAGEPYGYFDPHGFIVLTGWFTALIFAAPVLWLAAKLFLERPVTLGLFGRGRDRKATLLSLMVALGIGAPAYAQLAYLLALPIRDSAPVLASSLAWLLIVEIARTAAARGGIEKSVAWVAGGVAVVTMVPKLALFGYWAMQG
jgi:hypothetical protein